MEKERNFRVEAEQAMLREQVAGFRLALNETEILCDARVNAALAEAAEKDTQLDKCTMIIQDYKKEAGLTERHVMELQAELDRLSSEAQLAAGSQGEAMEELERLRLENAALLTDKEEATKNQMDLQREMNELMDKLAKATGAQIEATREVETWQGKAGQVETALIDKVASEAEARQQLIDAVENLAALEVSKDAEIVKLQDNLRDAMRRYGELDSEYEQSMKEFKELQEANKLLMGKLDNGDAELNKLRTEREAMSDQNNKLKQELQERPPSLT